HLKHGKETTLYEEYSYLPEDWRRISRTTGKYELSVKNRGFCRDNEEETFVSVYDGDDESQEYQLSISKTGHNNKKETLRLNLLREFIGGPVADDLEHTRYNRLSLAMLKDGLGSTIAITGREAKVLADIDYDAWGNFCKQGKDSDLPCRHGDFDDYLDRFENTRGFGSAAHNKKAFGKYFADRLTPYLYTGRRYSNFTSQYFNRNRYYSPALGRFTSKDPIGFNGGMNLYRYADNNPIIYTDPMGNSSCYKDLVVRVLNYFMDYNSPFVYSKATFSTAFSFFHQMENGPNISILDYSLKNTTHVTLGTTLIRKWTPETLAVFSSFDVPDTANEKIVNLVISDTNWRKDSRAGLSDTAVRSALIDGNYSDHSDPMKLGWTLAHETGHLLGLPDWFYRGELMMPANWPAMEFMEAHQDKILDSLAK
ncbi:MAG TPA: RHS repeat-associated core domain-containing protein, partial [Candidatus Rifleibacterium sp.]|nr:RHS repeat-associated core domain-containing protein [Candidatus Rifleibacterium sp.]